MVFNFNQQMIMEEISTIDTECKLKIKDILQILDEDSARDSLKDTPEVNLIFIFN